MGLLLALLSLQMGLVLALLALVLSLQMGLLLALLALVISLVWQGNPALSFAIFL